MKKLEGYVGFANLPNQVFRKAVQRGFEFTLMVVGRYNWIWPIKGKFCSGIFTERWTTWLISGQSGLGKSTLLNSLFMTDLYVEATYPATRQLPSTTEVRWTSFRIFSFTATNFIAFGTVRARALSACLCCQLVFWEHGVSFFLDLFSVAMGRKLVQMLNSCHRPARSHPSLLAAPRLKVNVHARWFDPVSVQPCSAVLMERAGVWLTGEPQLFLIFDFQGPTILGIVFHFIRGVGGRRSFCLRLTLQFVEG